MKVILLGEYYYQNIQRDSTAHEPVNQRSKLETIDSTHIEMVLKFNVGFVLIGGATLERVRIVREHETQPTLEL